MPRKYQHTKKLLPQIKEMLSQGMTQKQIEDKLGSTGYRPVHELLKRERKQEISGVPKQRGRKPTKNITRIQIREQSLKNGS